MSRFSCLFALPLSGLIGFCVFETWSRVGKSSEIASLIVYGIDSVDNLFVAPQNGFPY